MSYATNNPDTRINFGTISKPILILLRVNGMCPISIRQNSYTFSWLSFETTYAVLFYFGALSIAILSAIGEIEHFFAGCELNSYTSFPVIIIWRNILIPILGIISTKSLAVYLEDWRIFEEEFLTLTGKPLRFPYLKLTSRVILCCAIIESILLYSHLALTKLLTVYRTLAHCHASIVVNSVVALWQIQARLIATAFRELGDNFTTMMCSCERADPTDIRKCRLLYSKIVSLTTSFQKSTNVLTITTCIYSYMHMVYSIYWVLALVSDEILMLVKLSIVGGSVIYFVIIVVVICDAGQKIATAGGSQFAEKIGVLTPEHSSASRAEFQRLLDTVYFQAPKPALAEIVNLDFGLITTGFNIMFAYLTILYQLSDILEKDVDIAVRN